MIKVTGNENLAEIAALGESVVEVFKAKGLGNYLESEALEKMGRFIKLSTLLKSNQIHQEGFLKLINQALSDETLATTSEWENLHFSAMLPCGLRNPFKEYIESHFEEHKDTFESLNYLLDGNVNHELSFYPLLEEMSDESELPDIVLASDVNNFFHKPFIEKFINKGVFKTYAPHALNPYLEKVGFADVNNHYTMYTANMLIMVVDKQKLGDRPMPKNWDDILDPAFEKDIIMRGEDDFFCNAVMLPFYKEHGFDAIRALAKNIKKGLHPSEMVKMIGKNQEDGAAVYIMPYFFAKRINSDKAQIVWPEDGAIASPVFILVKEKKMEEHKELLEFLFNQETGEVLKGRYFPVTHPDVDLSEFPDAVKWLGWDFLAKYDIGRLKQEIREEFMRIY